MNPLYKEACSCLVCCLAIYLCAEVSQAQTRISGKANSKPDQLYIHRNLGKAYLEEEKYSEAIKEFQQCIEIAPDSATDYINLSLVLTDKGDYAESIEALDNAKRLDPTWPHIYYNLGIIHKREGRFDQAVEAFEQFNKFDPNCAPAHYNLGIVYKRLNKKDKALDQFNKVVELNPHHTSAHFQLFNYALRHGAKEEADREFKIYEHLRETTPKKESSPRGLEESKYTDVIEQRIENITAGANESKVRFMDVTLQAGLESREGGGVAENAATEKSWRARVASAMGSDAAWGDYNNDGCIDLYVVNCSTQNAECRNILYRNNGDGTFSDVTLRAGVGQDGLGMSCAFGDYDNDGDLDIYISNLGANVLYRNNGDGAFTDITEAAGVGDEGFGMDCAFVDYDHEGDLDIYVANYADLKGLPNVSQDGDLIKLLTALPGQPNVLYRNNGNETFTNVAVETETDGGAVKSVAVVHSDFDNDNDVDLYVVNDDAPNALFTNLRQGKFREIAESSGTGDSPAGRGVAVGDYNNDGWMDIYIPGSGDRAGVLYTNKRGNAFALSNPAKGSAPARIGWGAIFGDYDNDGDLDVFVAKGGVDPKDNQDNLLLKNDGDGAFTDGSTATGVNEDTPGVSSSRAAAFADYDDDGDLDLVIVNSGEGPTLLRNDGGNSNHWLKVKIKGTNNNQLGIGAKVEVRVGRFYEKKEVTGLPVHFGIGTRDKLDVVRVKWPNGIFQDKINVSANKQLDLTEKPGIPGSCPFLYTWNGSKYIFVTDFLDAAALGVLISPGVYLTPKPEEYVKIEGDHLRPKDGSYSVNITEELQETTYLDHLRLLVVDHPSGVDIYPDEKFIAQWGQSEQPSVTEEKSSAQVLQPCGDAGRGLSVSPPVIHVLRDPRLPISAIDDKGNDILPLMAEKDRSYPQDFELLRQTGLAEKHSMILDLGDLSNAKTIKLFLNGWVRWTNSSVNLAVSQNPDVDPLPPYLQVIDKEGEWKTVIENIGLPPGMGKTILVDLSGRFLSKDYRIRITTSLEVYWDQVLVSVSSERAPMRTTTLSPKNANFHWRGYSVTFSADGKWPSLYDYDNLAPTWSADGANQAGNRSKYGNVLPLLAEADNKFVIINPGDEVTVHFSADNIPNLPLNWTRDFLLYAKGWIKDSDPNTE